MPLLQTNFLLLYFAFLLLSLNLYKTLATKPIEITNRVFHEMIQGMMTWLTGGDVVDSEQVVLEDDEHPHVLGESLTRNERHSRRTPLVVGTRVIKSDKRGCARYRNGCRCLIIPAGYTGSSLWPFCLVILSGGRYTATATSGVLTTALVLSLFFAKSKHQDDIYIWAATACHAAFLTLCTYIEWFVYTPLLQFLILFYGVCSFVFILMDIARDPNPRKIRQKKRRQFAEETASASTSDTYACYEESWYCCWPRFVAFSWMLWAMALQVIAIWISMAEMSNDCEGTGWFDCIVSSKGVVDAWDGVDFLGFWQQVSTSNLYNQTTSKLYP